MLLGERCVACVQEEAVGAADRVSHLLSRLTAQGSHSKASPARGNEDNRKHNESLHGQNA